MGDPITNTDQPRNLSDLLRSGLVGATEHFLDIENIGWNDRHETSEPRLKLIKDQIVMKVLFDCKGLIGSLEVYCDLEFGKKCWPMKKAGFGDDEEFQWEGQGAIDLITDWLGEACNRITARLGRTLSEYGVEISIGTPILVNPLTTAHAIGKTNSVYYETKNGRFGVNLTVEIDAYDDVTLEQSHEAAPDAGDIVEFD